MSVLQAAAMLHVILYCGVLIGFRGYLLHKRTGINPLKHMKKTGQEGLIEKVFQVCFVLMFVVVLNFVFIQDNYKYLIPFTSLEMLSVSYTGIFLSISGLLFGFVAQLQMGDSWRLGFNENEKTTIINRGLYAYSRNPIYVGYLIANLGFFMIMPNLVSLLFFALSFVAIVKKVNYEETHLIKVNDKEYQNYMRQVRRWI